MQPIYQKEVFKTPKYRKISDFGKFRSNSVNRKSEFFVGNEESKMRFPQIKKPEHKKKMRVIKVSNKLYNTLEDDKFGLN